jgi:hypothetical protein
MAQICHTEARRLPAAHIQQPSRRLLGRFSNFSTQSVF